MKTPLSMRSGTAMVGRPLELTGEKNRGDREKEKHHRRLRALQETEM